tara:strand:- start:14614 stop:14910 length:297 start_codon:yes stop_codon:yes gene_type:complete
MKKNIRTYVVLAMTVFSVIGTTLHYHHTSVTSETLSIIQETETEFCCPFAHNQEITSPTQFSEGYTIQSQAFLTNFLENPYLDSNIHCQICDRAPPSI